MSWAPLEAVAAPWWGWISATSVQLVVTVALVLGLERLLGRRAGPGVQLALWTVVLAKLVLPPGLSSPARVTRLGLEDVLPAVAVRPAGMARGEGWAGVLFLAWLAVVLALLIWSVVRYRALRRGWLARANVASSPRLSAAARRAARRLGLRHLPPILVLDAAVSSAGDPATGRGRGAWLRRDPACPAICGAPAVLGFLHPLVLLPEELVRAGSSEELEHVLLHELAHVRRRDPWLRLLVHALLCVFWFHPLVWLARRRVAGLLEACCDATVAAVLREGTAAYRRTLLGLARAWVRPARSAGGAAAGLGFLSGPSQMLARLAWLERPQPRGAHVRRAVGALACGAVLACGVPLAPPAPAPAPAPSVPPLEQLEGCFQLRYAVFTRLAAEAPASGEPAP